MIPMNPMIPLIPVLLLLLSGCFGAKSAIYPDDSGADADSDADSDGDTDGDTDWETDVGTDVDSDGDADSDTDVDVDVDSDTDTDTEDGTDGCGGVDDECCADGPQCVPGMMPVPPDPDPDSCFCYEECEPTFCEDELDAWAADPVACLDVSSGDGVGVCLTDEDLVPIDPECEDWSETCVTPSGYADGICVSDGTYMYCMRFCVPNPGACDIVHTCTAFTDGSGEYLGAACVPNS